MKRKRYSTDASKEATKITKHSHLESKINGDDLNDTIHVSKDDLDLGAGPSAVIAETVNARTPATATATATAKAPKNNEDIKEKTTITISAPSPEADDNDDDKSQPLLYGRFRYIKTLGRGVFSETKLYEDCAPTKNSGQKLVAIKRMKPECKNIGLNEYDVLDRLHKAASESHFERHIVRMFGAFYGAEEDRPLHLKLEVLSPARVKLPRCTHIADSTRIIGHPCHEREKAFQKLVKQVLLGIHFLHKNGIIHADLHPGNILYSQDTKQIKLIDFGNSIPGEALSCYENHFEVCAEGYRAPELLFEKGPVCPAIDMWALGVICVEWILSDEDPFVTGGGLVKVDGGMLSSLKDLFGCGMKSGWSYCRGGRLWDEEAEATFIRGLQDDVGSLKPYLLTLTRSSELVRFVMSMLELNPHKRKTAQALLRDEWLVGGLLGAWSEVLLSGQASTFTPGRLNLSNLPSLKLGSRSQASTAAISAPHHEDSWEDEETFIDESELEARIETGQHSPSITRTISNSNTFPSMSMGMGMGMNMRTAGTASASSSQRPPKPENRLPPTPTSENNPQPAPSVYVQKPLPRTPKKPISQNASPMSKPGTRTPIHVRPELEAEVEALGSLPLKTVDFNVDQSRSMIRSKEETVKSTLEQHQDTNKMLDDDDHDDVDDDDDDEVALL